MAAGEMRDALADWLSGVSFPGQGGRRGFWRGVPREAEAVHTTRVLPVFIDALSGLQRPVVLDLGPVVGQNIDFLGGQLSCKLIIENLFAEVDRHVKEGREHDLPAWFGERLRMDDGSVDGIVCWDLCDYLADDAVGVLARQMSRILRPGGMALTMFGTERLAASVYTKYVVVDGNRLQHRWYPAARPPGPVRLMGQVLRLFKTLEPAASRLLVHQQREVLFRKPV